MNHTALAAIARKEFIQIRRDKGLAPVTADPVLEAGAQGGAAAFAGGPGVKSETAVAASRDALGREAGRRGRSVEAGCVHVIAIQELEQLAESPLLTNPALRRLGIGVARRGEGAAAHLVLVLVVEGAACG